MKTEGLTRYHPGNRGLHLKYGRKILPATPAVWSHVFDKWYGVLQRYVDAMHDEKGLPWDYEERPQVGFLAAAIWACDGVVLEEWKTLKECTKSGEKYGRCDMFARLQNAELDCHIEAKWEEVSLADLKPVTSKVRSCLESAQADANGLRYKGEGEGIAVAFLGLRRQIESDLSAEIASELAQLCPEDFGVNAVGWVCLSNADADLVSRERPESRVGMILLVKHV